MSESPGRKSVNAHTTPFLPYDMEGPVQPEMSWLPLSYDDADRPRHVPHAHGARRGDDRARPRGHGGVPRSSRATSSTRTARRSAPATS